MNDGDGQPPTPDHTHGQVMWFGADGAVHYAPAYPQLPPPPPPRRRWPIWLTIGIVGVLLLCVAPVAFVASRLPLLPAERAEAANPSASPSPALSPPAGEALPWIREQIEAGLRKQTEALLSGDQKAFLSTADSKDSKLTAALKRRFASLRALKVTEFKQDISTGPSRTFGVGGRREWSVRVRLQLCFVAPSCPSDPMLVESYWLETAAGLRMTALHATEANENGPRPWEISALKAAVGKRAIVATTNRYASRLPALLKQAETAAAVADKFAIAGKKPDRYRIFVAGPSEWKKWYGGDLPDWSVGFATPVGSERMEVVLNANEIQNSFLDEVLRHELGHVATLPTDRYQHDGNFWLIEGIAEYIQESGRAVTRYDGRSAVRRFVNADKWDGSVTVSEPGEDAPDWQVAARYGIGYYAVRRMAERFGRAKMVAFFTAVVLEGNASLDAAARKAFGVSWSNVNNDCAKYVHRQV